MKQKHIAEKLGINQSLVSLILSGKRNVSKDVALKMSEKFGNDPAFWLYSDTETIKKAIETKEAA